jgi:endonuclease V-like protein UPF0215 family
LSEKLFKGDKIIAIGIDDGYFPPYKKGKTVLAAVLFKGKTPVEIDFDLITIDGQDGTQIAAGLINKIISPYEKGEKVVFLDGVTYAGFNYINPLELKEKTGIDPITVFYKLPIKEKVYKALKNHFPDYKKRWRIIRNIIINTEKIVTEKGPVDCFTTISENKNKVYKFIRYYQFYSRIPEPLRLSDAIAREVSLYLRAIRLLPW